MSAPEPPSGRQHEIRHGNQRAVIVEVGGGLRCYETADGARLDGYRRDEMCSGGRGQPLIPWPNRVREGRYDYGGRSFRLALSEPEAANAIHGLVRWVSWRPGDHQAGRLAIEHRLHPQPGWPGVLDLRIEYALGPGGLSVTTVATNIGADACPYGAGFHPYLTLGTDTIDELILQAPGRRYLESDAHGIPISDHATAGTPFDYTAARPIGAARLDTGYTDLARDEDGLARVRLRTEDGQAGLNLWLDSAYPYLMLFTGDTLAPAARRRGLAVEPMTCAANALASGAGLISLEPGETHRAAWGIEPA
ncbi:MAG: aldose 1-epimerase family protein [Solirubrobacteraceae bacterium]